MINKQSSFLLLSIAVLASLFLCSCGPTHTFKHMNYLEDSTTQSERIVQAIPPMTIEKGDRVSIKVSALNMQSAQFYNGGNDVDPAALTAGASGTVGAGTPVTPTYLVNERGEIQFPQLGGLRIVGMTLAQVQDTIRTRLTEFLKEPAVTAELVNFKVNVLGEVARPGVVPVPDGKITIIEAISQCGDLTLDGLRDSIIVVREQDGVRTYGSLSLSSKEIYTSPYFYLKQGDLVYVRMNKNKLISGDQKQNIRIRNLALMFAGLSTLAILISVLK